MPDVMKRTILITAGCVSAALGTIGAFVPLLPTVPLYLLAALCLACSSRRLHERFVSTRLYQEHLKDYAQGQGLYLSVKLRIMLVITIQLAIGYALMCHTPVGRLLLVIVWMGLMLLFLFGIQTRKAEKKTHGRKKRKKAERISMSKAAGGSEKPLKTTVVKERKCDVIK